MFGSSSALNVRATVGEHPVNVHSELGPVPLGTAPSLASPDLEALRAAYRKLSLAYATVLGEVTKADSSAKAQQCLVSSSAGPRKGSAIVRRLAGTHVRKHLHDVAARCAQLEATLDRKDEVRLFLADLREGAERTASHLPRGWTSIVAAVIPVVLGLRDWR
jgi:hypothetical protein